MTLAEFLIGYVLGGVAWVLIGLLCLPYIDGPAREKHSALSMALAGLMWPIGAGIMSVLLVVVAVLFLLRLVTGGFNDR